MDIEVAYHKCPPHKSASIHEHSVCVPMDIHGYSWISLATHGCSKWSSRMSADVQEHPASVSMDIHGHSWILQTFLVKVAKRLQIPAGMPGMLERPRACLRASRTIRDIRIREYSCRLTMRAVNVHKWPQAFSAHPWMSMPAHGYPSLRNARKCPHIFISF